MNFKSKKSLVVYYSRNGLNYAGKRIKKLPRGNTEIAAEMIGTITDSPLFKIETIVSYPLDYIKTLEVAFNEKEENIRPDLIRGFENIEDFDILFFGYPNWWGTMPMAGFTLLESYDFSGKIILPFCTDEGSGLGNSIEDIKNVCSQSDVLDGLAIHGTHVMTAYDDINSWLKNS